MRRWTLRIVLLFCVPAMLAGGGAWVRSYAGEAHSDWVTVSADWYVYSTNGEVGAMNLMRYAGPAKDPTSGVRSHEFRGFGFSWFYVFGDGFGLVAVPWWAVVLWFAVASLGCVLALRRMRPGPGCCRACGYDLRGSAGACPECGAQRSAA